MRGSLIAMSLLWRRQDGTVGQALLVLLGVTRCCPRLSHGETAVFALPHPSAAAQLRFCLPYMVPALTTIVSTQADSNPAVHARVQELTT